MSNKMVLLCIVVSLAAGALIQKQWDSKNVKKIVDTSDSTTTGHTITVIKKIKKPDGTTETDTTRTEDTIKKEIDKHIAESSKAAFTPTWLISGGVSLDTEAKQAYSVSVQRQILGPIWIGLFGTTRKEAGVSLGVLF